MDHQKQARGTAENGPGAFRPRNSKEDMFAVGGLV